MTSQTPFQNAIFRPGDIILEPATGGFGSVVASVVRSPYCHVRLVVDEFGTTLSSEDDGAVWENHFYEGDLHISPPLTDDQRDRIFDVAARLHGTPYDTRGMVLVGLARLGLRLPWLSTELANTDKLFCSQLVDLAWRRAGFHAFDDGRQPQDVTPGDLADLAFRSGWSTTTY